MESALKSLESSGGYAILLGIVLVGLFYIFLRWSEEQAKRGQERELAMRSDYAERVEHSQQVADAYRDMTDRMIAVVQGNTEALAGVLETNRAIGEALSRIDRHINGAA